MRYWLTIIALITCTILVSKCAEAAECFATPRQVWREHPHEHATWNYVDGKQCWRAGHPSAHAGRRRGLYGMASPAHFVPIPRPRRDWEILHPEAYPRLSPADGRALAHELFGEWPQALPESP
jgi:hypothetical protein